MESVNQSSKYLSHSIIWPFLFCIRLGNLGQTEPGKLFRNFKWLKNCEDGSDFDDFWTKQIAALSAKFWKKVGPSKKFPWGRKIRKTFAKSSKNFGPYTVFGTKQNRNVQLIRKLIVSSFPVKAAVLFELDSLIPPDDLLSKKSFVSLDGWLVRSLFLKK